MRKLVALLLAALLLFTVTACGNQSSDGNKKPKPTKPTKPSTSDVSDPSEPDSDPDSDADGDSEDPADDEDYTDEEPDPNGGFDPDDGADDEDFIIPVEDTNDTVAGGNTADRLNPQKGGADKEAAALRDKITGAADTLKPAGKVWYISRKGNDANTGESAAQAWYSISGYNANRSEIRPGDTVLFERGGVYRGTVRLVDGVSYGAYGSGPKPAIYGSPNNFASKDFWETTELKNVWKCSEPISSDVGNIIFDHGRAVGIRVFTGADKLSANLQYYYSQDDAAVYLYLEKHPAEVFYDIEFGVSGNLMQSNQDPHDITIDNLALKYGGTHAIRFEEGAKNIRITNCEIGWVGGCVHWYDAAGNPTRLGNGVELWNECDNVLVENNWIYQMYDTGITNQGSMTANGYTQSDITYRGNLIEYCTMSVELWTGGQERDTMKNVLIEENILRFAGYGWGMVRTNHKSTAHIWSATGDRTYTAINCVVRNNIFDRSWKALLIQSGVAKPDIVYTGNSYYQKNDSETIVIYWEGDDRLSGETQEKMEESVRKVDAQAKTIRLL